MLAVATILTAIASTGCPIPGGAAGGSVEHGSVQFAAHCGRCHGTGQAPGFGPAPCALHGHVASLTGALFNREAVRRFVRTGRSSPACFMPAFTNAELADRDLNDILAYLYDIGAVTSTGWNLNNGHPLVPACHCLGR